MKSVKASVKSRHRRSPSYLTVTKSGHFVFQRSMVKTGLKLFRRSVQTSCPRIAKERSVKLTYLLDEVWRKYGHDEKVYGRIVYLISKYESIEDLSWNIVEQWLMDIDDEWRNVEELLKVKLGNADPQFGNDRGIYISVPYPHQLPKIPKIPNSKIPQEIPRGISFLDSDSPIPNSNTIPQITQDFLDFKEKNLKPGSFLKVKSRIDLFQRYSTEQNINTIQDISPQFLRDFRDIVQKLPKNRHNLEAETIQQLIEQNHPTISNHTAVEILGTVSMFIDFCCSEGYSLQPNLTKIFDLTKKIKSERSVRIPFSKDQLNRIFSTNETRLSDIWVPLIALYTGMRQSEILQLTKSDVQQMNGHWVFNINEENGKSVKTQSGKRIIPIHHFLLNRGILNLTSTSDRLFNEKQNIHTKGFDEFSKRFAKRLKTLNITANENQRLDFHSFRHTVRTALVEQNVPEIVIDSIMGHSPKGSTGLQVYTHSNLIQQKVNAIGKLDFSLNIGNIFRESTWL